MKTAAIDKQALVDQSKESLSREQSKIDNAISQQNKILDSAKSALLRELDSQQAIGCKMEKENTLLTNKMNDLKIKVDEYDFKLKIQNQNHVCVSIITSLLHS